MLIRQAPNHCPSIIPLSSAFTTESDELTIGRHLPSVDVHIDDRRNENVISRVHAKIRRVTTSSDTQYDLISVGTNGLAVNGVKILSSHRLCDGDSVHFAPQAKHPSDLIYVFRSNIHRRQSIGWNFHASPNNPSPPLVQPALAPTNSGDSHQPQAVDGLDAYNQADGDWSRYWGHDERKVSVKSESVPSRVTRSIAKTNVTVVAERQQPPSPSPASPPTLVRDVTNLTNRRISSSSELSTSADSWNSRFQAALDEPEIIHSQIAAKYEKLSKLNADFVTLAKSYGRTIISEYFLPPHLQTIPYDQSIGGLAGGRKYSVRGILFKLCTDVRSQRSSTWLYGGEQPDTERANKAGGNELRAAANCFAFHSIGLRVPIIALVDYSGFRLLAMPILPIQSSTLIYGSSDCGVSVQADDSQFNTMMAHVARELHWAPHIVNNQLLYSAGDVEGHRGADNRYYLLDLARCFPPEDPFDRQCQLKSSPQSVLFRQLRPELLQIIKSRHYAPVSPDAFSGWGAHDAARLNEDVRRATQFMLTDCIPALAHSWITGEKSKLLTPVDDAGADMIVSSQSVSGHNVTIATFQADEELFQHTQSTNRADIRHLRLSEELHSHGINVRHLGRLRHHILQHYSHQSHCHDIALLLLVEMVSRTLKNLLRSHLRSCTQRVVDAASSAEFDSIDAIVARLNCITGADQQMASSYWAVVGMRLTAQFGKCAIDDSEKENLLAIVQPHLLRIIDYLCLTCGIALSPSCEQSLSMAPVKFVFTVVDVELRVTVKSMPIIDYAEVRLLLAQADSHKSFGDSLLTPNIRGKSMRARVTVDPQSLLRGKNSLLTSVRLLSLAVQLFDRLRHAMPFNGRYKTEARQCRTMLRNQQQQLFDIESQSANSNIIDDPSHTLSLSQVSQTSSVINCHATSEQPHTIRTGLSTGFARFAVSSQQPITTAVTTASQVHSSHQLSVRHSLSQSPLVSASQRPEVSFSLALSLDPTDGVDKREHEHGMEDEDAEESGSGIAQFTNSQQQPETLSLPSLEPVSVSVSMSASQANDEAPQAPATPIRRSGRSRLSRAQLENGELSLTPQSQQQSARMTRSKSRLHIDPSATVTPLSKRGRKRARH